MAVFDALMLVPTKVLKEWVGSGSPYLKKIGKAEIARRDDIETSVGFWHLSVHGYGEWHMIATGAQAEEARAHKAQWEKAVGRKRWLRDAAAGELERWQREGPYQTESDAEKSAVMELHLRSQSGMTYEEWQAAKAEPLPDIIPVTNEPGVTLVKRSPKEMRARAERARGRMPKW